jgi:hypothetical protein
MSASPRRCSRRNNPAAMRHGGEARIRAARFPARKTLEEFERLRGGERRLHALASSAIEVALAHEAVFMDDEKRERVRLAQELVGSLPFTGDDEVGLDAGAKRTSASTRRYPPSREPVLVAHVRFAPDQRASDRRPVGRRPRPDVHAEHQRSEQPEDAARDQQPPTHSPRLRCLRLTRGAAATTPAMLGRVALAASSLSRSWLVPPAAEILVELPALPVDAHESADP